jgi:hypothetical protein
VGYWWARTPHQDHLVEPDAAAINAPRAKFAARREATPQLSREEAEKQRAQQYRDVHTIDDLRALPAEFSRREALYVIAGRADWPQLRGLIAAATALPNEAERLDTLETLWLRYAELDPEAALRSALETDRATATRLVAVLARTQPQQSWEAVARISDPLARIAFQKAVVTTWAPQEPDRAFATVQAMPRSWQRRQLLEEATAQIAQRDPTYALELVKGLESTNANSLRLTVALEWVKFDPAGAAQWVETLEPQAQGEVAYQVGDAFVAQQPEAALAWALRIAHSPGRNLWSHLVGELARQNRDQAWQLAQSAENPAQRMRASGAVIRTIASTDPALAATYLEKIPPGAPRSQIAAQVGNDVSFTEPALALAWLESIGDSDIRVAVANSMAVNLARSDVETAAKLMDRVPKEARRQWMNAVAMAYANADPVRGGEWLARQRDVPGSIVANFAANISAIDPETTLDVINRFDEKQRQAALMGVLPKMAQQAPEAAARMVDDIADRRVRAQVTGRVATIWARYDEAAARKWVTSLPWGDPRDQGLEALVNNQNSSLDDRLTLIGQIQSPDTRSQAVWNTAMSLVASDPEGARTVLRRYPLGPEMQAQLESTLRQHKEGTRGVDETFIEYESD